MEPILVEYLSDPRTRAPVGRLFLTEEMSRIAFEKLSEHYDQDLIRGIILSYYEVAREYGEIEHIGTDQEIKYYPDRFFLRPNHKAERYDIPEIVIELPSGGKDVCFIERYEEI